MYEQHRPGEIVKTSGIYKVVHDGDGGRSFEVTCVQGEHFPPTRSGKGATMNYSTPQRIRTGTANSCQELDRYPQVSQREVTSCQAERAQRCIRRVDGCIIAAASTVWLVTTCCCPQSASFVQAAAQRGWLYCHRSGSGPPRDGCK